MISHTILPRLSRLSLVAGSLALAACAGRTPTVATAPAPAVQPPVVVAEAPAPAPSAFDVKDLFYSQNVPAAKLASLEGALLVVGFVDPSCSAACTATLNGMAAIEKEADAKVHFLVVSTLGEQGSPAALASFAKAHRLRSDRYTVISGTPDGIASLISVVDQGVAKSTVAQLQSSSTLSVLDYNGIAVRQRASGNIGALLESLTLLANMR